MQLRVSLSTDTPTVSDDFDVDVFGNTALQVSLDGGHRELTTEVQSEVEYSRTNPVRLAVDGLEGNQTAGRLWLENRAGDSAGFSAGLASVSYGLGY